MKKLFVSLSFALISCSILFANTPEQQTIYSPETHRQETVNQTECKIFWDIHKTLVKRDKQEFLRPLVDFAPFITKQLVRYGYEKVTYSLTGKKGPLLHLLEEKNKLQKKDCSGEGYFKLFKDYDDRLAELTEKMANAYKPIRGMPELVQKIQCEQLYASNIGKRFLSNLQEKELNTHFPAISGGQVISFDQEQTEPTYDQETNITTVSYSNQKPAAFYFEHIQDQFNHDQENTLVFIDDKIENVEAAKNAGFIGILFKNPERLQADLQSIGLVR